ncbi:OsmC family protein [Gracilimonas tropica]|uniref:OsmC family protein n=1 Tax=Gracilimonas tropica TaxID=454600 RepID=UPI000369FB1E|nr:OsmC family protein [Gracilimonas tropica]
MPTKKANAVWKGDLKSGNGTMKVGSGAYEGAFSFATRFEDKDGSNPEELIGAAHAGCFSMAFSNELDKAGFTPDSVETEAEVTIDPGSASITTIKLITKGHVPNIDEAKFQEIAEAAKKGCPVSKALTGVDIHLDATLIH